MRQSFKYGGLHYFIKGRSMEKGSALSFRAELIDARFGAVTRESNFFIHLHRFILCALLHDFCKRGRKKMDPDDTAAALIIVPRFYLCIVGVIINGEWGSLENVPPHCVSQ